MARISILKHPNLTTMGMEAGNVSSAHSGGGGGVYKIRGGYRISERGGSANC